LPCREKAGTVPSKKSIEKVLNGVWNSEISIALPVWLESKQIQLKKKFSERLPENKRGDWMLFPVAFSFCQFIFSLPNPNHLEPDISLDFSPEIRMEPVRSNYFDI
jgi:hypothetical protein